MSRYMQEDLRHVIHLRRQQAEYQLVGGTTMLEPACLPALSMRLTQH